MAPVLCVSAQDAPHRLAARAQGDTPLMQDLRELCDGIGGRPTGSPAADRAIEWAAKKFRDVGIQNVSVEPFTAKSLWLPVSAETSGSLSGGVQHPDRGGADESVHQEGPSKGGWWMLGRQLLRLSPSLGAL